VKQDTLDKLTFVCGYLAGLTGAVREDTAEAVATADHIQVIKHYNHLRIATNRIKEAREALDDMEQRLSREQVPDVMRAHNVRTITIEDVGRVTISQRWSASMLDKEQGITWLKGNNLGGIVQETVNSQTLAAVAKDLSQTKGIELPATLFKVGQMSYTSITKA
jgi:hypothetical protein